MSLLVVYIFFEPDIENHFFMWEIQLRIVFIQM